MRVRGGAVGWLVCPVPLPVPLPALRPWPTIVAAAAAAVAGVVVTAVDALSHGSGCSPSSYFV